MSLEPGQCDVANEFHWAAHMHVVTGAVLTSRRVDNAARPASHRRRGVVEAVQRTQSLLAPM